MRGVRVGTRASITSRSSIDGNANGAGNGLGGTDGGADGDGAEQQGCDGRNQGPRKLRLIQHFVSPFFSRSPSRVDVRFNSRRVPIPEIREKSFDSGASGAGLGGSTNQDLAKRTKSA